MYVYELRSAEMDSSASLKCFSYCCLAGKPNLNMYTCAGSGFFLVFCFVILKSGCLQEWLLHCGDLHNAEAVDRWKRQICHLHLLIYQSTAGKKIALFANLPLLPRNKTILSISENGPSLPKKVSRDYKSNLIHYTAVFFMCSLIPRRKTDDNTTFDTVCHNPAQKLHGLVLEDYNNSKCEMKEVTGMGSQFFICSCSEDECNEHIFFNPCKSTQRSVMIMYFLILDSWGVRYSL